MIKNQRQLFAHVLFALGWAVAFIASAIIFKGNPIKEWVQAALFIIGLTVWLWQSGRVNRSRC